LFWAHDLVQPVASPKWHPNMASPTPTSCSTVVPLGEGVAAMHQSAFAMDTARPPLCHVFAPPSAWWSTRATCLSFSFLRAHPPLPPRLWHLLVQSTTKSTMDGRAEFHGHRHSSTSSTPQPCTTATTSPSCSPMPSVSSRDGRDVRNRHRHHAAAAMAGSARG
jgi:hypothetical protein